MGKCREAKLAPNTQQPTRISQRLKSRPVELATKRGKKRKNKKKLHKKLAKIEHFDVKNELDDTDVKKQTHDTDVEKVSHDTKVKKESHGADLKKESIVEAAYKYTCTVCKKKCKSPNGLSIHIVSVHQNYCIQCNEMFSSDEEYKQHLHTHNIFTGEDGRKKQYVCGLCGKSFSTKHKLKDHTYSHNTVPTLECDICHQKLKTEGTLMYHKKTKHRNSDEKRFKCEFCEKLFWSNSDLKIHLRVHTNDRPYLCHICSKTFKSTGNLANHQRAVHEDRHWMCEVCGEKCKTKAKFIQHCYKEGHGSERKPVQLREFPCEECGKIFTRKNDLKIHFRIHSGAKPYKCTECGKDFRCYNHLKQHTVTHTGEKPFQCTYCYKKFSQRANVNCHMKTCQHKFHRIVTDDISKSSKSTMTDNYEVKIQCTDKSSKFVDENMSNEHKAKKNVIYGIREIHQDDFAESNKLNIPVINIDKVIVDERSDIVGLEDDGAVLNKVVEETIDDLLHKANEDNTTSSVSNAGDGSAITGEPQQIDICGISVEENSILNSVNSHKTYGSEFELFVCKNEILGVQQPTVTLLVTGEEEPAMSLEENTKVDKICYQKSHSD